MNTHKTETPDSLAEPSGSGLLPYIQRLVLALWPYWLGFTLAQLILWPFDMSNAGVLVGLYLGSMAPLLRENSINQRNLTNYDKSGS